MCLYTEYFLNTVFSTCACACVGFLWILYDPLNFRSDWTVGLIFTFINLSCHSFSSSSFLLFLRLRWRREMDLWRSTLLLPTVLLLPQVWPTLKTRRRWWRNLFPSGRARWGREAGMSTGQWQVWGNVPHVFFRWCSVLLECSVLSTAVLNPPHHITHLDSNI